jgi:translation initiation factor 2B subunit (eIF-2B alpha/beta/delta family)
MPDRHLKALAEDRVHGAGWLARAALDILAGVPRERWPALAAEIEQLRPEMPALAEAVREAVACGDVRAVLSRADAEADQVVTAAAALLAGRPAVATLSNSALVARLLLAARPPLVEVLVTGGDDEGHLLVAQLTGAGVLALAVTHARAGIGVVGCDAVFDDHGFVNRRGTARLLSAVRELAVLVEHWKRVPGPSPTGWPGGGLFEVVRPHPRVRLVEVST